MHEAVGHGETGATGLGSPAMLRCAGLRKRYGDRLAVDGVSFSIAERECYGLLGPNGAGKTTTISMLCGLTVPDEGEIIVDGAAGGTLEAKAAVGYVPQDLALYPDLSAVENLTFFGQLYGLAGRELQARIGETLELVGSGRPREGPHRHLLRRHEAAGQHGGRPAAPAQAPRPRRADGRRRPPEPQRHPRDRRPARHRGPLHHALHGGGRQAVRPHRHHRRRPTRRGGDGGQPDRRPWRAGQGPPAVRRGRPGGAGRGLPCARDHPRRAGGGRAPSS